MKLTMLGANHQVTGSATLLQVNGLNILIDYGMIQDESVSKEKIYTMNFKKLPIDYESLDYVVLTHSHLDHIGRVPMLDVFGFNGEILTTALTAEIMDVSLRDSANIIYKETELLNKRRKKNEVIPLYVQRNVDLILNRVKGYSYNQEIKLSDKVTLEFKPNGHIAGSAFIYITYQKTEYETIRVLFTGDTSGFREKPFTMLPNIKDLKIDILVTESTYGGVYSPKSDILKKIEDCIVDTCLNKNKTIMIPVFAISRCTEVLYYLKKIYEKNKLLEKIPIYFASKMGNQVHRLIGKPSNYEFYDDKWKNESDLFKWDKVEYIDSFDDVQSKLQNGRSKVVLSCSGMLGQGYSSYLGSIYLPTKGNNLLFCGYQAEGTEGRKVLDGNQKTITLGGKPVRIRADIDFIEGMSGHAYMNELVEMLRTVNRRKVKKIVINHGNLDRGLLLKEELKKYFDAEILIPKSGQIIKL